MAIEKTYFTSTSYTASAEELYTYLAANATDYFDTIERAEDDSGVISSISCSVSGGATLTLLVDSTLTRIRATVELSNGTSFNIIGASDSKNYCVTYFDFAKKTPYGIMLNGISTSAKICTLIITKTTAGATMVIADSNTSASIPYTHIIDMIHSSADKSINTYSYSFDSGYTTLSPLCTDYGSYTDSAFVVAFTQFGIADCNITADGNEYALKGHLALKG